MRSLVFAVSILLTQSVFARQMFQCSIPDPDSTDVMVVNLDTPQKGTLFLSSGPQAPGSERVLVNIAFSKTEKGQHVFKVVNEQGGGKVTIPSAAIGKSLSKVKVEIEFSGFGFSYSCFSRMH